MWVGGGGWVGGMRANTETSRSSARARAATTMSISTQVPLPDYVSVVAHSPQLLGQGGQVDTLACRLEQLQGRAV